MRNPGYTLARRIYTELGLKRVAILRINSRYGRFGVIKFRDASRRLGHPPVIEQKFLAGETDFTRQLKVIQGSHADAIVLWTDEIPAANILKQMRELGMKQRVFGSYRTLGPERVAEAGPAVEGFEAVFPYDPTRNDPRWLSFNQRFEARFHEKPEQFAALAYDAMNALLDSICKAGLNRARIHDALANIETWNGVTSTMVFDPNQKNVAPMYLGTVHDGTITYRPAPKEKTPPAAQSQPVSLSEPAQQPAPGAPYAIVGEDGVKYTGPMRPDAPSDRVRVVLFGKDAGTVAQSEPVQSVLAVAGPAWHLLAVNSDQNWGAASTQLVHALIDEHALAIVALDRDAAHLAEQLALKTFVPVLAVSSDRALTSTNVPWIFRLPATTAPDRAIALLRDAEARSGPNPQRLRDVPASGEQIRGMAFLATGEPRPR
jgi:branched-chain amino acid transport system substrate-binding protein